MKIIKKTVITIFFLSFTLVNAQDKKDKNKQEIKKPSEGKALVYFIRPNSTAFLVEFKVFHGDKFLGKIASKSYLTYECEPGEQLFWASSENRDYIIADLDANKTYVIEIEPEMGAFVAGVSVKPCFPNNQIHQKSFYKAIAKSEGRAFTEEAVKLEDESKSIAAGLEKYKKLKESGSDKIARLNSTMNFLNADKPE
jgi:hypothetical protein